MVQLYIKKHEVEILTKEMRPVRILYTLRFEDSLLFPETMELEGDSLTACFNSNGEHIANISDVFILENGILEVRRSWQLYRPGPYGFLIEFTAQFGSKADVFIPSVMYRDNVLGTGSFPRKHTGESWAFIETRTPIPGCVQLYDDKMSLLACTEPASSLEYISSSCASISCRRGSILIRFPGQETPKSYIGKTKLITLPSDDTPGIFFESDVLPATVRRRFYCCHSDNEAASHLHSYRRFAEVFSRKNMSANKLQESFPSVSWDQYRDLKFLHLMSLTEIEQELDGAFVRMGRNNGGNQFVYNYTSASFLVKSLEAAVIIARESERDWSVLFSKGRALIKERFEEIDADFLIDLAEKIGRFFLRGELFQGLHQDCFDLLAHEWGGYLGISEHDAYRHLVNARCNGESMSAYIQLYELLRNLGREVREFIDLPKRVADFYISHQLEGELKGSFGRWWTLKGKPENSSGTNGAYIISFLLRLEPYYEDKRVIENAVVSAGEYYRMLATGGHFYGDTLDADCCDKEAGIALLSAFLDLYERFGEKRWLEAARQAAEFVLTWIWQYDCYFAPDTPLGRQSFHTTGMTAVSVAHHHLDFYGIAIAYEYLRLWEHSGEGDFYRNALLMLRACKQLIALPGELLGRDPGSVGWQPEQINHTHWDYFDRTEYHSGYFDIDIAWVTVLGLGAYQKLCDRFPHVLEATEEKGR